MQNLQKAGGVAALSEAIIYVAAFIYFGVFWDFPQNVDAKTELAFLTDTFVTLSIVNLVMYLLFGALLSILVIAIHERLKSSAPILSSISSIFGLIWIGLVFASGMIANIGLGAVIDKATSEPEQAMALWLTVNVIVEGLGGGNEIVGGLWVLLMSLAALAGEKFPKPLCYLGVFVGLMGILTIYPAEVMTVIFGLSQIVWFAWLGGFLVCES